MFLDTYFLLSLTAWSNQSGGIDVLSMYWVITRVADVACCHVATIGCASCVHASGKQQGSVLLAGRQCGMLYMFWKD